MKKCDAVCLYFRKNYSYCISLFFAVDREFKSYMLCNNTSEFNKSHCYKYSTFNGLKNSCDYMLREYNLYAPKIFRDGDEFSSIMFIEVGEHDSISIPAYFTRKDNEAFFNYLGKP